MAEGDMKIANLGTYASNGSVSDSQEEREAALRDLRHTIDVAVCFGARSIRIAAGRPEDPALIDRMVPYFQRSCEYAEEEGTIWGSRTMVALSRATRSCSWSSVNGWTLGLRRAVGSGEPGGG